MHQVKLRNGAANPAKPPAQVVAAMALVRNEHLKSRLAFAQVNGLVPGLLAGLSAAERKQLVAMASAPHIFRNTP
jgi:hypothetical protein